MLFRPVWDFLVSAISERTSAAVAACEPPGAYTAVLLREAGPRRCFVLQKRIRPGKLYYGRIAMFGGHRDGDETPEECAIREVAEETGIRLEVDELARVAAVKTFDNRGDVEIGHLFFVDNFDPKRLNRRQISGEGKLVRLSAGELRRNYHKFTPVTSMALLLFFEYQELKEGA